MSAFADAAARLFSKRIRGFRAVNVAGGVTMVVLALGVYAFKADAGAEGAKLREVDRQVREEARAVRLLRAEVAHLEQPERLQRLAGGYLGLRPMDARRELTAQELADAAHRAAPAGANP